MGLVEWTLLAALGLIFIPHVAFVLWYGSTRPWWKSWEGRALMASASAWSLISGAFLVDNWREIPDWLWPCIGLVAAVSGWMKLGLLVSAAYQVKRKP